MRRYGVLVDDEDARPGQTLRRLIGGRGRLLAEVSGKPERRTAAGLALHPDIAAHQFDQLRRDRESQAGATVLARSCVSRLGERLKQMALAVERYSNARVLDRTAKRDGAAVFDHQTDADGHLAIGRELDGVADKIRKHLAKPGGVAAQHHRNITLDVRGEFNSLALRLLGEHGDYALDHAAEVEVGFIQHNVAGRDF